MQSRLTRISMLLLAATPAVAAPAITPGQWTQQVRTTEIDAPGLPAQVRQNMPGAFSHNYCLTPEEAARGPREMLQSAQRGAPGCRYDKFDMAGGRINAAMQCKANGGTMHMTMRGTYTPTSYEMTMTMESDGIIRRMTSVSTGRRTGPCK